MYMNGAVTWMTLRHIVTNSALSDKREAVYRNKYSMHQMVKFSIYWNNYSSYTENMHIL